MSVAWIMVVGAGLLEMVWSYSAKQSDGFTRLGWGAVTILASLVSFFLLTFAMRNLPLGTAYAVWTGIGAVGSFVVGIALLGEFGGAVADRERPADRRRGMRAAADELAVAVNFPPAPRIAA